MKLFSNENKQRDGMTQRIERKILFALITERRKGFHVVEVENIDGFRNTK